MKHAYLIIAHNEFEVLQYLVTAIDDGRNDIYIHFDAKVQKLPVLNVNYSRLFVLEKRISVYWGDVSMIQAEYILLEEALKKHQYRYFHLLSGVDLPLKHQNEIHEFLEKNDGKEFIGYTPSDLNEDVDRKMRLYHLFPKNFMPESNFLSFIRKIVRFFFNLFQTTFGIHRNRNVHFRKGPQWVSITNDFVSYLLSRKKEVLKIYRNTYCPDEYFMQTECWNSVFRDKIYDMEDEFDGCLRCINWKNNVLIPWQMADFDVLMRSNAFFARKFSSNQIELVKRIAKQVK